MTDIDPTLFRKRATYDRITPTEVLALLDELSELQGRLKACEKCPTYQKAQEVNKILRKRVP